MSVITNQTLTLTITSGSVDTVIRKDNCRVDVFGDYVRLTDYTGERYEFLFSDITTPLTTSAVELAQAIEEFLNTGGGGGGGNVNSVTGSIVENTDPANPVVNLGYLRLSFNVTQSGTDAPDVTVNINEVGAVFTPEYDGVGGYTLNWNLTVTDLDKVEKFGGLVNSGNNAGIRVLSNSIVLESYEPGGTPNDDVFNKTSFEVRFYPGWDA